MTHSAATWIEDSRAAHLRMYRDMPGVELHDEPEATWALQSGSVWGNCAVRLRLDARNVDRRLDEMIARFRQHRRGAGFWISAASIPADLGRRLRARGFLCRKHFPGMVRDLHEPMASFPLPAAVRLVRSQDVAPFREHGHPYFGPANTKIRRFALDSLERLLQRKPQRITCINAELDGWPIGSCTVSIAGHTAELFDVGVVKPLRRRGIGSAVVAEACQFARDRGCRQAVLIAAEMGLGVYCRIGFVEACKLSYYYSPLR